MRFLIFGGVCYYGCGGANDFLGREDSLESAALAADRFIGQTAITEESPDGLDNDYETTHPIEWAHVFDTQMLKIVHHAGKRPYGGQPTLRTRGRQVSTGAPSAPLDRCGSAEKNA